MIRHISERIGYSGRCWLDEKETNSIHHLLSDCPALRGRRLQFPGIKFVMFDGHPTDKSAESYQKYRLALSKYK